MKNEISEQWVHVADIFKDIDISMKYNIQCM